MKLHLFLPLLACAALGAVWWLGSSERRRVASATVAGVVQLAQADDPRAQLASAHVPTPSDSAVADAPAIVSPDSTRTPSADVAPPPATFALRGTVCDERDAPVEGCQVIAVPGHTLERSSSESERPPIYTVASPGGRFAFEPIEPGAWYVHAERGEQSSNYAFVAAGGSEAPIALRLVSSVRVAGVVLDPDGRPFSGGRAVANSLAGHGELLQDCDHASRFEFQALAGGPIVVYARAVEWADSEAQHIELVPGAERTDLVLTLRRGAWLMGELLSLDGAPRAGVDVSLEGATNRLTRTDELGRFAFERLSPGDYAVAEKTWHAQAARGEDAVTVGADRGRRVAVELAEGETRQVVLGGPAPAAVLARGLVRRGGAPCPSAKVTLLEDNCALPSTAYADADGRFALSIARSGALRFAVSMADGPLTTFRREVPTEGEVELDFELAANELVVRVLGPDGRVRGASLTLASDDAASSELSHASATTDAEGRSALLAIAPGDYVLTVGSFLERHQNLAPQEQRVTLGACDHRELDVRLSAGAELAGTVRGIDGVIFPGVEVIAVGPDQRVHTSRSNGQGEFSLVGLLPGRERVFARTKESASAWREVEARAGEAVNVELVLAPAAQLEIEVVGEHGELVEARVVLDADGAVLGPQIMLGPGVGELARMRACLPPGVYSVTAVGTSAPIAAHRVVTLTGTEPMRVRVVLAGQSSSLERNTH